MIELKVKIKDNIEETIYFENNETSIKEQLETLKNKYSLNNTNYIKSQILKKIKFHKLITNSRKNIIKSENTYSDISKITNKKEERSALIDDIEELNAMEQRYNFNDIKQTYENLFKKIKTTNTDNNKSQLYDGNNSSYIKRNKRKLTQQEIDNNFDRLYKEKFYFENKLKRNKILNNEHLMKECTFKPNISQTKRQTFSPINNKRNIFERLYNEKNNSIIRHKGNNNNSALNKYQKKKFDASYFENYLKNKNEISKVLDYLMHNYDFKSGQKLFMPKINKLNKDVIKPSTIEFSNKSKKIEALIYQLFMLFSNNKKYIYPSRLDIDTYDERVVISFEEIIKKIISYEKDKLDYDAFINMVLDNNLIYLFIDTNNDKSNKENKKNNNSIKFKSFYGKLQEIAKNN